MFVIGCLKHSHLPNQIEKETGMEGVKNHNYGCKWPRQVSRLVKTIIGSDHWPALWAKLHTGRACCAHTVTVWADHQRLPEVKLPLVLHQIHCHQHCSEDHYLLVIHCHCKNPLVHPFVSDTERSPHCLVQPSLNSHHIYNDSTLYLYHVQRWSTY